jgi:uncharacterized protein (DUF1786 family)
MSRFLLIDVGAGTMDILYYDDTSDIHYKAVVRSPVRTLAEKAANLTGNLLITGCEMGGGPITAVLRQRAQKDRVVMTASAAFTLQHNLEKVRSWGIRIIGDADVDSYKKDRAFSHLALGDIDIERIERIVTGFGVSFSFDIVGLCAQDHGMPPTGESHLDYRHALHKERLDQNPFPHALLYSKENVPATLNRLGSITQSAEALPADEIYVMDSGMAAIVGASMDRPAQAMARVLVLDIATSHTVGAAMLGKEIAGYFEYHTHDITLERLETLLQELADGHLNHQKILEEGGHGAYVRKSFGFEAVEGIIATGPKRRLVSGSKFPIRYGAPWGDNMMTGTVGLLEAIRRHKSLDPIPYL